MKKNKIYFKRVFVLGGTSEIAKEICINLVKRGTEEIHFLCKEPSKNIKFINYLKSLYKIKITSEQVNLLDYDLLKKPSISFYDLYLIAAGYLGDSNIAKENQNEAIKIAKINYLSLIPWLNEITCKKRIAKEGSLWILSSVAGDLGRPSNYHYGAAKAALTIFCEGLLNRCQKYPFRVRIIKAGVVSTSMSKGKYPKIISVSKNYVAKTLLNNPLKEGIEYLPYWWFFVMKFISILPRFILNKL